MAQGNQSAYHHDPNNDFEGTCLIPFITMDAFSCLSTSEQITSRMHAKEALIDAGRTWTQLSIDHKPNHAADFTPQPPLEILFTTTWLELIFFQHTDFAVHQLQGLASFPRQPTRANLRQLELFLNHKFQYFPKFSGVCRSRDEYTGGI